MIGVVENDFFSAGGRRIVSVAAVGIGGYPVGGAIKKGLVIASVNLEGHANRMGRAGLPFVFLDQVDHVVLPRRGRGMIFIGNFIEHVVHVPDGIDYFPYVGFLDLQHFFILEFMYFQSLTLSRCIETEPVDIIIRMERMISEALGAKLYAPSLKQHDEEENVLFPCSGYPLSQPFEVGFIKLGKIKFWFSVQPF